MKLTNHPKAAKPRNILVVNLLENAVAERINGILKTEKKKNRINGKTFMRFFFYPFNHAVY